MSTRATYQFKTEHSGTHTVYIHYDGYPLGASHYLENAISEKGLVSTERFLRFNKNAQLTKSHEAHGDTEYRYTITGDNILVFKRIDQNWVQKFDGIIVDFIMFAKQYNDDWEII
tara:strand:- start:517 stop:861 length:345 start_codon:yes stop_codon:yes gene_type:complete